MLRLTNLNPAADPLRELFDDAAAGPGNGLPENHLRTCANFSTPSPPFGPERLNLIDLLIAPVLASPHSLKGQLEFILCPLGRDPGQKPSPHPRRIGPPPGGGKIRRRRPRPGPGPDFRGRFDGRLARPVSAPGRGYAGPRPPDPEPETSAATSTGCRMSSSWPRTPTSGSTSSRGNTAARSPAWTRFPTRSWTRWRDAGFTGLWLIGIWERSRASQKIKQMMGNPEAVASAYSLYRLRRSPTTWAARRLSRTCATGPGRRGIRLAGDMVPNHMGIDSRWVDRTSRLVHPACLTRPFPAYSLQRAETSPGDDASGSGSRTATATGRDAAVVFERLDKWTGDVRYIYHGNDGTSYALERHRPARFPRCPRCGKPSSRPSCTSPADFPIIRFDAAMTLAKRHFQRLWFPEPGTGGDIPSRAEHGLSREEFDAAFPEEFWREVVDRVAAEAPDTLLLAEAFWLMEGYFVRTLGMHRVYNSAFMNMLSDEENAKYRQVIKNTLEFNPEILKRYVNFMNNPGRADGRRPVRRGTTSISASALLMATLPGLPMFGHGQVEGFAEKYGMEYRRAYYDEAPDRRLIQRHESEIFPLLRKRGLFARCRLSCSTIFSSRTARSTKMSSPIRTSWAERGRSSAITTNTRRPPAGSGCRPPSPAKPGRETKRPSSGKRSPRG